ncbi:MAG: alpha/beta hydrolase family protein [Anaeroplasma sp.]
MEIVFLILVIILFVLFILFFVAFIIHKKIFGSRFTPNPLVKYYTKEEFGLNADRIEFYCGNNLLKGYLYSNNNYNKDYLIIYCHGMFSCKEAYMQDIGFLCNHGFQVLGFDYIGVNESEGKNIKGFSQSLKCLDKLLDYVKKDDRLNKKRIYVIGHSWGGYASINIPKYHSEVEGIICLAPFCSISKLLSDLFKASILKLLIPFFLLIELFKVGRYAFSDASNTLKKYKGKVLVIHSKDDSVVNYIKNTFRLQNEFNESNYKFLIVNGKNHNPNYSDNAIKLLDEYSKKTKILKDDDLLKYKQDADYHAMGELDNEVMLKIVDFILN